MILLAEVSNVTKLQIMAAMDQTWVPCPGQNIQRNCRTSKLSYIRNLVFRRQPPNVALVGYQAGGETVGTSVICVAMDGLAPVGRSRLRHSLRRGAAGYFRGCAARLGCFIHCLVLPRFWPILAAGLARRRLVAASGIRAWVAVASAVGIRAARSGRGRSSRRGHPGRRGPD